jgi:hypothetical protein
MRNWQGACTLSYRIDEVHTLTCPLLQRVGGRSARDKDSVLAGAGVQDFQAAPSNRLQVATEGFF